jgi:phage tail-like protein
MSDWFKDHLLDLLPPLYDHNDEAGDLRTFLSLPSGTLDTLKQAIDEFPTLFDVDHCDEPLLPLLASLVGFKDDGACSPDCQRRRVREAVEIYRRKGTIPAIERDFKALEWQGELQETFHSTLRLNARSRLSNAKLPGQVFSLGVFRVLCLNQTEGLRDALLFHHPAGTRCFWLQVLLEWIEDGALLDLGHANAVRRIALAFLDETFVLGRSSLGSYRHLTNKQKAWELLQLTSTTTMMPEIDRAAVKVSRFHGRQKRMRLNRRTLNDWRLPYTRVAGDYRVDFCTPLYTGRDFEGDVLESGFGLGEDQLNHKPLTHGATELRYCFRQKDLFFDTQAEPVERVEAKYDLRLPLESCHRLCFQLGRARLNQDLDLNANQGGVSKLLLDSTIVCDADVTRAVDRIDRWRRRGPVFRLNANTLNTRYLSNAKLTGERASLEVYVDTGSLRRHRVETMKLGASPLNTTGLRLSVDRTRPMRISRMRLNQAGFRWSRPSYRWLFRQQDLHTPAQAGFEAATNKYRVTQWPT